MALESASFITGLVSANPPGGDNVKQGDDHLRLIKAVLLASFPTVSRAFQLTKSSERSYGTRTITAASDTSVSADDGKLLYFDTSSNAISYNLMAAATAGAGFRVHILKRNDANALSLTPAGTEQINNVAAALTIGAGDAGGILECDGTAWRFIATGIKANVSNIFTQPQSLTNAALTSLLDLASTDAGAAENVGLSLFRNSAFPAANDILSSILFDFNNSAAARKTGVKFLPTLLDHTSTTEDVQIAIQTIVAGSLATRATISQGLFVAGTDPGAGKINATGYQQGNLAIDAPILTVARAQFATASTTSTTIPDDDTIPQNTEGAEFFTVSITPKSATSILEIEVQAHLAVSTAGFYGMMICQDSIANSIASGMYADGGSGATPRNATRLTHYMTSGTTSAITFRVRAGPLSSTGGTLTINGVGGSRKFGGTEISSIIVKEYAA